MTLASAQANVVIRAGDPVIGPQVPANITVGDRRIFIAPNEDLAPASTYFSSQARNSR